MVDIEVQYSHHTCDTHLTNNFCINLLRYHTIRFNQSDNTAHAGAAIYISSLHLFKYIRDPIMCYIKFLTLNNIPIIIDVYLPAKTLNFTRKFHRNFFRSK